MFCTSPSFSFHRSRVAWREGQAQKQGLGRTGEQEARRHLADGKGKEADSQQPWKDGSSLCLCQLGLGRAGESPRRDSQALCLTSSGQVLVFLCVSLVSQQHISHLFVRAIAAAGAGLRNFGKFRAKSSNQGWSLIRPDFVLAAATRDGLQEKGATIETSKYVIEP